MRCISFLFPAIIAVVMLACKAPSGPDISHIRAEATIVRIDSLLQACAEPSCIQSLLNRYPGFSEIYFKHILQLNFPESPDSILAALKEWKADSTLTDISGKVAATYGDMTEVRQELNNLFAHLKFYFPDSSALPAIYTYESGMAMQSFIFREKDGSRDGIGIGLDMMLHPDVPYKQLNPDNTAFSAYLTRSWNKQHLTRKVAETILTDKLGQAGGARLIDQMILEGKKIWLLEKLMPEAPDTIITEFSQKHLQWCHDNDLQMWSFFFDEKLFFETSPVKIAKYVFPAPNSAGMPDEAPGRTGVYLGWQIVSAYMKRYPKTTIPELLSLNDGQALLEKSRYKPER